MFIQLDESKVMKSKKVVIIALLAFLLVDLS